MNQEDYFAMSEANQRTLRNAFSFLGDISETSVTGEKMVSADGIPLNAIKRMKESDFVKDWLMPFALSGRISHHNYFNFPKWGSISNQHTMSILIHEDNDKSSIIFILPPLSDYSLKPDEVELLRKSNGAVHNSIDSIMSTGRAEHHPDEILEVVEQGLSHNKERLEMHELVPLSFYHRHGVYVNAIRQMVYVRDVLFNGQIEQSVLEQLLAIFEKEEREGAATLDEYKYVKSVCGVDYNIPYHLLEAKGVSADSTVKNNEEDNNTGIDITSC